MYTYQIVAVPKVVDGDTFDVDVDVGFYTTLRIRIRLKDIDTYEIYGRNADPRGQLARDFAINWLMSRLVRGGVYVRTFKLTPETPVADAAFGRWLGEVYDSNFNLLSDALREAGHAED